MKLVSTSVLEGLYANADLQASYWDWLTGWQDGADDPSSSSVMQRLSRPLMVTAVCIRGDSCVHYSNQQAFAADQT